MKNVTIAIVFFYGILHVATSKFCRNQKIDGKNENKGGKRRNLREKYL